jgi:hypothetical protein
LDIVGLNDKQQREFRDGVIGMRDETIPGHVAGDEADEMW